VPNEALLNALRQLYNDRESWLGEAFDRSIPFADAILDNRWSRAERLGFAEGVSIYDSALVFGSVAVGEQTWIGPNVILDGTGGGIKIGAYCSIAAGVHLYTHDTVLWAVSGGKAPRRKAAVEIGDCCHIGAQSILLPGVKVGRKSIVAANSLVNKDVPEGFVVAGTPARMIGRVEGEGAQVQLHFDSPLADQ
jgi:acetyltransferase-like isoleucine patch superfamily enzyme